LNLRIATLSKIKRWRDPLDVIAIKFFAKPEWRFSNKPSASY